MGKIALIAGATGLVGSELLKMLLANPNYEQVISVGRSAPKFEDKKLKFVQVDFDQLERYASQLKADDYFCCLGTTMRKAGSKEAFYKVDFSYCVNLAKIGKESGGKQFLLISGLGADTRSMFYYSRVKAETEAAIMELKFPSFHILRPSLLIGDRKEQRPGEYMAILFNNAFSFMIPEKYKGIHVKQVAFAMMKIAESEKQGLNVYDSDLLQKIK